MVAPLLNEAIYFPSLNMMTSFLFVAMNMYFCDIAIRVIMQLSWRFSVMTSLFVGS